MHLLLAVLACVVACGAPRPPRPVTGAIAGIVRDRVTGEPIAKADVRVRGAGRTYATVTDHDGLYDVDHLAPGTYALVARFAGQSIEVTNIAVRAGVASPVDLELALGEPGPVRVDWSDLAASEIRRYRPTHGATTQAIIEGTVSDVTTRQRVAGAVVTVIGADPYGALQSVSDDRGRFRFGGVTPGTYTVSAYYNVAGRGQIEVLRSGIAVAAGEAVVVPLLIEMTR